MADQTVTVALAHEPSFDLGVARVNPATREFTSPRGTQILEPRVMQVLVVLARAGNSVVSRHDLTMAAWDGVVVGDDAINRVLSRLRKLSDADAGAAFELRTIVKVGYVLTPGATLHQQPLAPEDASPQTSTRAAGDGVHAPAPASRRRSGVLGRGLPVALVILIVIVVVTSAAVWLWFRDVAPVDPMPVGHPVAVASIVTAPLDADAQQLGATLHDDMVVDLTQAGLTVASGDASDQPDASSGATFRVAVTLVPDGAVYTLTVQVDHLPTRAVLWSRNWQGDLATLGRRRDEIALRVADMLALAYDLRGNSRGFTSASLPSLFAGASSYRYQAEWPEALRHWKRLASANPTAASAWGVAAQTAGRIFLSWDEQHLPSQDKGAIHAQARQFAKRALALDRRTPQAYAALSDIEPRQNFFAREAILQRGLAAMGGEDKTLDAYLAVFFSDMGYWGQAAPYAERALKTDPNSRENIIYAAIIRNENGDQGSDLGLLADTMKRWPDDAEIWGFMLQQQEEVGHLQVVRAMMAKPPVDAFTHAERQCFDAAIALEAPGGGTSTGYDMVERCFKESNLPTGFAFDALQRGGAPARAFDLMKWAAETKRCETICLVGHTPGTGFRQQPGYWPLVERIGLVRYWRQRRQAPNFCTEPTSHVACARAGLAS